MPRRMLPSQTFGASRPRARPPVPSRASRSAEASKASSTGAGPSGGSTTPDQARVGARGRTGEKRDVGERPQVVVPPDLPRAAEAALDDQRDGGGDVAGEAEGALPAAVDDHVLAGECLPEHRRDRASPLPRTVRIVKAQHGRAGRSLLARALAGRVRRVVARAPPLTSRGTAECRAPGTRPRRAQ